MDGSAWLSPGQRGLIDSWLFLLQMILHNHRPQSPSLLADVEAPNRTCSRRKLSYSNGTSAVDEDETQLISGQSCDSQASVFPPTGSQLLLFFFFFCCLDLRRRKVKCGGEKEAEEAEEEAGKSSARDARPVPDPDPDPGLGLSGRL